MSSPASNSPTTSGMETPPTPHPISDEVLRAVYASDQEMYPAGLSYDRLCSWVAACPEMSICWSSPKTGVLGVVIVLPMLREYWEDLLVGKLKEPGVDADVMFPHDNKRNQQQTESVVPGARQIGNGRAPNGRISVVQEREEQQEVGLHVYHIERLAAEPPTSKQKRLSEIAVEEVTRRATEKKGWKVVGLSALTATDGGKRTFQRLGFKNTGYRELFVTKVVRRPSYAAIGIGNSPGIPEEAVDEPEELDMLYIYPEDGAGGKSVSEVIGYGRTVVSMSEMTVKYLSEEEEEQPSPLVSRNGNGCAWSLSSSI
ncbi:hypothetical protein QBC40DRAFT_329202 [Triangularia verruculosa]|uniref:Uncharacterized protein n=1 Tax=Triangularia verruculosa TaxID=2587418 RepID=A0AAN6XPX3_9PEZI|nr:hypothetical protein QBC40DRAFT_329202 [Triangularia verruculosa]